MAGATGFVRHTQIAGIDKFDEIRAFIVEKCVGADRIGGTRPAFGKARLNMRILLHAGARIAAMAIDAAQLDSRRFVHFFAASMTRQAAFAFAHDHLVRLPNTANAFSTVFVVHFLRLQMDEQQKIKQGAILDRSFHNQ